MVRIEINERTKAGKLVLELVKFLSENKTGVRILGSTEKEDVLQDHHLTNEETAFYRKFRKAIEETKAMESGELEGRPLKEVLDEL